VENAGLLLSLEQFDAALRFTTSSREGAESPDLLTLEPFEECVSVDHLLTSPLVSGLFRDTKRGVHVKQAYILL